MASGTSSPITARTSAIYCSIMSSPFSVKWRPVKGCITLCTS